jgi:hypothetical protein
MLRGMGMRVVRTFTKDVPGSAEMEENIEPETMPMKGDLQWAFQASETGRSETARAIGPDRHYPAAGRWSSYNSHCIGGCGVSREFQVPPTECRVESDGTSTQNEQKPQQAQHQT